METDNTQTIQIRVNDIIHKECFISGLEKSLTLCIQREFGSKIQDNLNPQDYYMIPCAKESENGIYIFKIEEQVYEQYKMHNVFLGLDKSTQAKTFIGEEYLTKEYKQGFCVIGGRKICQINTLECLCNINKPIPYELQTIPNSLNIGILKAYKASPLSNETGTCLIRHSNANTNLNTDSNLNINTNANTDLNTNPNLNLNSTSLSNPHNEIYTLDTEQTIQLRAFVYEGQRTKNNGNITKTIQPLSLEESLQIQWAFKIVEGTYLEENPNKNSNENKNNDKNKEEKKYKRNNPFPLLGDKQIFNTTSETKLKGIPQGYVILEDKTGDCITLSLKDLFIDTILDSLVNKNIIFFAYDKNVGIKKLTSGNGIQYAKIKEKNRKVGIDNAYTQYAMQDYQRDWSQRKITQDRITSIEFKILKTRFSLEFDGETLTLLENQRETNNKWEAESLNTIGGIPIENLQKDTRISLSVSQFQEQSIKDVLLQYKIETIPLKVQYQKRILILIERFKQTTESTMGRIYLGIDGKIAEIKRVGKSIQSIQLTNLSIDLSNLPSNKAFGVILDRPGPDSIGGELNLRIPSGRYEPNWGGSSFGNTFNLSNTFVPKDRKILIHYGNSPKDSDGCMLLSHSFVKKGKQDLGLLQVSSQDVVAALRALLETKIPEYLGVKERGSKFINAFVTIYVINAFKE